MELGAIFYIIILIMSVVIHEVSHGQVANLLGDPTAKHAGRLTLNPIKHIDLMGSIILPGILILLNSGIIFGWAKPVPYNPHNLRGGKWGPAYVAIAGPLSNIIVATAFGLFLRFALPAELISPAGLEIVSIIVILNIILALFNLIPVPPLDGSKVLFSALPYHLRGVEEFLTRYQLILVLLVIYFAGTIIMPGLAAFFRLLTGIPLGL